MEIPFIKFTFHKIMMINILFDQPDVDAEDYSALCKDIDGETLQDVLRELTIRGTKWNISRQ
ncbi:hypothetical protein J1N35_022994, partial [Gossypium stocksii]